MASLRMRFPRVDAAIRVLRPHQQPLHVRDIVEKGYLNGLFERNDDAMVASVNAALNGASKQPSAAVVRVGRGRYALREWGLPSEKPPERKAAPARVSRTSYDAATEKVADRLREILGYLEGLIPLSSERVCLLIEFCYLLELDRQAVDLYLKLPKDEVDDAWMKRVRKLERVCRTRLEQ